MAFGGFGSSPLAGLAAAGRAARSSSPGRSQGNPFAYFRGIAQRQQNPFANFTTQDLPGTAPVQANPGLRAYVPPSGLLQSQLGGAPGQPPGPPATPPAGKPPPGQAQPSPLDSTYWLNVASNLFGVNNKIGGLQQQGGYASTDLQNALSKLAYQEPRDQLRLTQQANSRGSLFSTPAAQQQSNLSVQYGNRQGDLLSGFARGQAGRNQQIAALEGSVPLYDAQQALGATSRAARLAATDPSLGEQGTLPGGGQRPAGTGPPAGRLPPPPGSGIVPTAPRTTLHSGATRVTLQPIHVPPPARVGAQRQVRVTRGGGRRY